MDTNARQKARQAERTDDELFAMRDEWVVTYNTDGPAGDGLTADGMKAFETEANALEWCKANPRLRPSRPMNPRDVAASITGRLGR